MATTMERVIPVPNETEASFSRNTCDGRKITYELKVLQQPERARACGSGAKSSADRRPVDPPPIVELRIFEGEDAEKDDITFRMNANFFLFATLEQARPMAHGRVAANDPSRLTVLTGTPVAGMVYLDRPEPGGYFIFPDLSVRHEGKYRLGFSLYEELKCPKDFDQLDDTSGQSQGEAHITHRLEVKSQPFMVYSAKKFPGLKSSTQLSRTVAEQGCRVRIRREVRMRRREKKGEYDGYSDGGYERSRHSATPDGYQPRMAAVHPMVEQPGRERSASIGSHASTAAVPVSRRPSGHDMAPTYPQASYVPQSVAQPAAAQSIPPTQHQYPPQFALQYMPQQPPMQHPHMHYPQYPYSQAQAPPPAQAAPQHSYYAHAPPMGHTAQYEEYANSRNAGADYAMSASSDSRRPSMAQPPIYSHAPQAQSYPTQYASANGHASQQTPKMRQLSQASQLSPPASAGIPPHILPPINTNMALRDTKFEISPPASAVSQPHYYGMGSSGALHGSVETGPANGKRGYDRVFDSRHMNAPLRQGARPSISHGSGSLLADDGNDDGLAELEHLRMSYRRADGREIARPLPPSV